ncbi:hypothetical protein DM01DRAFT_1284528 [Hesseltinella vesiculosa]|uniref:RING-type domain-containing protein n=1 Tax=Hesseltinella vesiculosa TaxID=101127 RepID=A0A1X2GMY0_9FUNG|nr:hypothetical protein DM01DRAFT_1284528 [Hesseltinella vesiculosa]
MPAIFLRTLSFVIGCLYRLISRHHGHYHSTRTTNVPNPNTTNKPTAPASRPTTPPAIDDERNHLYFWLQRCSICLEQTYSLCLESCRDQFCKDCFARYVEETVQQSWGLGISRIKCPVCQDIVPQTEWSRYVSKEVVAKYNRFNQPYRPFARHCVTCDQSVIPCVSPRQQGVSREDQLNGITELLRTLSTLTTSHQLEAIRQFFEQSCQNKQSTYRLGHVQELYQHMVPPLAKLAKGQADLYTPASQISKQLVAMELVPEAWKQSQFLHVSHFPMEPCAKCKTAICLQCGEKDHRGCTCLTNLKTNLIPQATSNEQMASLQWKVDFTPCPNCSVLINRDEGCNRVDCLLCGHRFCWHCLSPWSQAELGVPDMSLIDAKRRHG